MLTIKKVIKLSVIVSAFVGMVGVFVQPAPVFAQTDCQIGNISGCKSQNLLIPTTNFCSTAPECIKAFLNVGFILVTLGAFAMILIAGVDYVRSNKVEDARAKITNAVIGLVIIILAWAITSTVLSFFGATDVIDRGLPGEATSQ